MKKILTSVLAASLMLLGTSAFAQVSVGAGYSNSKMTYSYSSGSSKVDSPTNGFYAPLRWKAATAWSLSCRKANTAISPRAITEN